MERKTRAGVNMMGEEEILHEGMLAGCYLCIDPATPSGLRSFMVNKK